MIFTNEQLENFKYRARRLMVDVGEWPKNPDIQAGKIAGEIGAVFSEGYHTAMYEVRSTPWEYLSYPILTDAARNDAIMNGMASEGWELQFVNSGWHLWRRRKAVAKIAAKKEAE